MKNFENDQLTQEEQAIVKGGKVIKFKAGTELGEAVQ